MGRRVIRASDFQLKKCSKTEPSLEDRISHLPREILIYILSFLTLKEAGRTSILSKCWKDLWIFVDRLNFDASKVLEKLLVTAMAKNPNENLEHKRLLKRVRRKYVKWVNKVLQSHKALVLDEFRIFFDLDKFSCNEIDKWLHYAFAKSVQRLELDLSRDGVFPGCSSTAYTFSLGLLGLNGGKSSEESTPGYCDNGIHPRALVDFKSLRALSLRCVNVTGEVLKFFLHNCPFLERLLVDGSQVLESVEVCGPSLALQHLEICYCFPLKSIIVRNTKLVSLKITQYCNLVLSNVPMLVDVWVCGSLRHIISGISCCLSKLEVLTLRVYKFAASEEKAKFLEVPQLSKLKQLTLVVRASMDDILICFTSLIRASPNLEKFVLKLDWCENMVRKQRKVIEGRSLPLQHLKVVELYGYYGRSTEVELVKYLLENAIAIEKIIVDPRDHARSTLIYVGNHYQIKELEREKAVRSYVKKQLEGLIPSAIELVLL